MKTRLFSYELPEELIAQYPADQRDHSRMMVLNRLDRSITHQLFSDLPTWLNPNDLLVLNETKVLHARIFGQKAKTGGNVEFLFLEEIEGGTWDVLMRASRRPKVGDHIVIADGKADLVVLEDGEKGRAKVHIQSKLPFLSLLEEYGEPPLPPYIKRKEASPETRREDRERYQTIYARQSGAIAAPTAGLHFTPDIFKQLEANGVERTPITLHVGIGTFQPVTAEDVADHNMFSERYEVPEETVRAIREARAAGGRVIAIGSTSVRTLESAYDEEIDIKAGAGRTQLFIHPPYTFRLVDAMLTNFHLPQSTLMMMISALADRELILEAYEEAVKERYRFYSYGDCMLIL